MKKNIMILLTSFLFLTSCSSVPISTPTQPDVTIKVSNEKSQNKHQNLNELIGQTTALSWFKEHRSKEIVLLNRKEIDQKYFYDIRPLKLPIAIRQLKSEPIVKLEERIAKNYNPHYKSEKGMHPYLIRGVFSNFTGGIVLYLNDNVLTVSNYYLGSRSSILFSPLIVNLTQKPSKLVLELSGAK